MRSSPRSARCRLHGSEALARMAAARFQATAAALSSGCGDRSSCPSEPRLPVRGTGHRKIRHQPSRRISSRARADEDVPKLPRRRLSGSTWNSACRYHYYRRRRWTRRSRISRRAHAAAPLVSESRALPSFLHERAVRGLHAWASTSGLSLGTSPARRQKASSPTIRRDAGPSRVALSLAIPGSWAGAGPGAPPTSSPHHSRSSRASLATRSPSG